MRFKSLLVSALGSMLAAAALAGDPASACKIKMKSLQDHLLAKHPGERATIAAFDHRERTWCVDRWDGSALEGKPDRDEEPDIVLRARGRLLTFVIDTNPLIFTADRTETVEAPIETLATLQRLVAGIGSVMASDLVARDDPRPGAAAAQLKILGDRTDPARSDGQARDEIASVSAALREAHSKLNAALDRLGNIRRIFDRIGSLGARTEAGRLLPWLQAIESNVPIRDRPKVPEPPTVAELLGPFNELAAELAELAEPTMLAAPCRAAVDRLREALTVKRALPPKDGDAAKLAAYRAAVRALAAEAGDSRSCDSKLGIPLAALATWLAQRPPTDTAPSPDVYGERLDALDEIAAIYLERLNRIGSILEQAKAIAKAEPEVVAVVARMHQYLDRLRLSRVDPASGVLEVTRSSFSGSAIRWSQTRTDTVEVALDESLKGKIALRHPDKASGSFRVIRAFSDGLEADFALTRTDLFSSSFEAKDADGVDGGSSRIEETDRSTRSGELAVMAAYRFPLGAGFAIGPQVGVGADLDHAAIFYGLSVRWRFLSLGYGRTRQKVKALDGQTVGQELAAGEVVRTRDRFTSEPYWSLAISIRDLPFFKPKE